MLTSISQPENDIFANCDLLIVLYIYDSGKNARALYTAICPLRDSTFGFVAQIVPERESFIVAPLIAVPSLLHSKTYCIKMLVLAMTCCLTFPLIVLIIVESILSILVKQ